MHAVKGLCSPHTALTLVLYNILHKYIIIDIVSGMKQIEFLGDSLDRIRAFPSDAKQDAGYQLGRLEEDRVPMDWKPVNSIGPGVREIRIREAGGAFRVIYTTNLGDRIYVLHAFQKKTQKTPKKELDLAKQRLADVRRK